MSPCAVRKTMGGAMFLSFAPAGNQARSVRAISLEHLARRSIRGQGPKVFADHASLWRAVLDIIRLILRFLITSRERSRRNRGNIGRRNQKN